MVAYYFFIFFYFTYLYVYVVIAHFLSTPFTRLLFMSFLILMYAGLFIYIGLNMYIYAGEMFVSKSFGETAGLFCFWTGFIVCCITNKTFGIILISSLCMLMVYAYFRSL